MKELNELWSKANKKQKGVISFILFCIIIGLIVFNGYAVSLLWKWFIVPVFNVGQLSIPAAIGISSFINFILHQRNNNTKTASLEFVEAIIYSFVKPIFALSIGWILTLFL